MRIRNYEAGMYAGWLRQFDGSNLYARRRYVPQGNGVIMYAVYSYYSGWPLYINYLGVWYENGDFRSRATAKHREDARPTGALTVVTTRAKMLALLNDHIIPTPPSIVELMFE